MMKIFRLPALIFALCLALPLSRPVLASGPGEGGTQVKINNEVTGPYTLLVSTGPQPLEVGQINVWVRVKETVKNQTLAGAVVTVEATPPWGGPALSAPATHENAGNPFNYLAHLQLDDPGEWQITVSVEDEPGIATVSFTETVIGGSNMPILIGLTVPFVILLLGVGVYLYKKG